MGTAPDEIHARNERYVVDAFRAGASGFLLKTAPPDQLVAAVRTVHAGEALLRPRARAA